MILTPASRAIRDIDTARKGLRDKTITTDEARAIRRAIDELHHAIELAEPDAERSLR